MASVLCKLKAKVDDLCNRLANGSLVGPAGPAGADGQDGIDGVDGNDGADGAVGPPGPVTPQEICEGPFTGATARTGWWAGWTAIFQANTGTQTIIPWQREHQVINAPDCISDFSFQYNVGNWYLRNRRNRVYVWIDYRLLVNGAVVYTRTNQVYRYHDERDEQNDAGNAPAVPVNLEPWGGFADDRLAIPANATVEIETQVRWNVNGSQASSWARLIGGLRSTVQWTFTPREIVTGRE